MCRRRRGRYAKGGKGEANELSVSRESRHGWRWWGAVGTERGDGVWDTRKDGGVISLGRGGEGRQLRSAGLMGRVGSAGQGSAGRGAGRPLGTRRAES